jgi:hypothetical protein
MPRDAGPPRRLHHACPWPCRVDGRAGHRGSLVPSPGCPRKGRSALPRNWRAQSIVSPSSEGRMPWARIGSTLQGWQPLSVQPPTLATTRSLERRTRCRALDRCRPLLSHFPTRRRPTPSTTLCRPKCRVSTRPSKYQLLGLISSLSPASRSVSHQVRVLRFRNHRHRLEPRRKRLPQCAAGRLAKSGKEVPLRRGPCRDLAASFQ